MQGAGDSFSTNWFAVYYQRDYCWHHLRTHVTQYIRLAASGSTTEASLTSTITDMSEIGVLLLLFLAGLETDSAKLRSVGATSFWGALGGVLIPFSGGISLGLFFGFSIATACFIGALLTATSVTITSQVLLSKGHQRSHAGTAIMGAAIIDDILGILILSLMVTFSAGGSFWDAAILPVARMIL